MIVLRLFAFFAVSWFAATLNGAESWPQFRGPDGNGISAAKHLPQTWSQNQNIAWKTAIDGQGWSSPVLVGKRIWLTTANPVFLTEEEKNERLKDAKPFQRRQANIARRVELKAVEIDYESGEIIRTVDLFDVKKPGPVHLTNSYASPTPVADEGFLYCFFGTYGACSVDMETGEIVWRNTENEIEHNVGPGSSPAVIGDLLVLTCDGVDKQYVTALNKYTGKTVWTTQRPPFRVTDGDQMKAYSTPLGVEVNGKTQIIIPGAQWVVAYDPESGDELWRVDHGKGFSNVPRPIAQDGVVYICTGFTRPELWAIRTDGKGDVTETHVEWTMARQVPTTPSPVLVDGRIYMVSDRGVATCVDAKTGDVLWSGRLGGNFSASPTYADGKIYFCNESGVTKIVEPGDELNVVAENDLEERIMANPIFVDGNIVLRTSQALYRIKETN